MSDVRLPCRVTIVSETGVRLGSGVAAAFVPDGFVRVDMDGGGANDFPRGMVMFDAKITETRMKPLLAIVVPLWQRHALARAMLAWTRRVADEVEGFDVTVVAVGSEGDATRKIGDDAGACYVEFPNGDLSAKWNAGVAHARELGADAVMILGSDDLVSVEVLRAAASAVFDDGADMFGLLDHFACGVGPRVTHWPGYNSESGREGETIGSARTFSRALLDKLSWRIWPDGLKSGLDGAAMMRLRAVDEVIAPVKVKAVRMAEIDGVMLDVKAPGDESITSFAAYAEQGADVDPAPVLARFGGALEGLGLDVLPEFLAARKAREKSVSLVMIARQAETTIGRALRCAMPVCDEMIVVVDDRTTDRTAEIAASLGARVETTAWRGMAGQRNYADSLATGDYALILDSDETIDCGDVAEQVARMASENVDAVLVTTLSKTENGVMPFLQARVLRRGRTRWKFALQNEVAGIERSIRSTAIVRGSYVGRIDGIVEKSIPKFREMFGNPVDDVATPAEVEAHAATWLTRMHILRAEYPEARAWGALALSRMDPTSVAAYWARCQVAWAIYFSEGPEAACAAAHEILRDFGDCEEPNYILGGYHFSKWVVCGMQPGRFATVQHQSRAFLPWAPFALSKIGINMNVREVAAPEEVPNESPVASV